MRKSTFINIEKTVCNIFEKEYGLFARNGRTAIWLLLEALGFKQKRIIVPANICVAAICAIISSNNEPFFVDIDDNFSIGPDQLKDIDPDDAAGIIFPYMYGNTGAIEEVMAISRDKGWIVIEDAAQSLGAMIGKRYAGSFADFSMTSFGMGKIIDVNAGGVLCVNSRVVYQRAVEICRKLNQLDLDSNFTDQLEARLKDLQRECEIRHRNAIRFQSVLDHENVQALRHNEGATYWRQNILVKKDRDGLLRHLKENGIKASKYFPSIDRLFYDRGEKVFEGSDSMASTIINLWPGKETSFEDIARIDELIKRFYNHSNVLI